MGDCQGPCLPYCSHHPRFQCSRATAILAYAALWYLAISAIYLVVTQADGCFGIGTPFKDSLSDEQRDILAESKRTRRRVFCAAAVASALVLLLWRPLHS